LGHVKPVKVVDIFPAAEIVVAEVNEIVTVVAVDAAILLLNIIAPPVIAPPYISTKVPEAVDSIIEFPESRVAIEMSVLAAWDCGNVAPVQVNVTVPAGIALADNVTAKVPEANADEAGSEVPAGAVNLHTGVAGHIKLSNPTAIRPEAGMLTPNEPVIVTVTPVSAAS